jgi:hypothetical protein
MSRRVDGTVELEVEHSQAGPVGFQEIERDFIPEFRNASGESDFLQHSVDLTLKEVQPKPEYPWIGDRV